MNYSYSPQQTCSCSNSSILNPGSQCDICMGQIAEKHSQETEIEGWYNLDYFEDLENSLSAEGRAA